MKVYLAVAFICLWVGSAVADRHGGDGNLGGDDGHFHDPRENCTENQRKHCQQQVISGALPGCTRDQTPHFNKTICCWDPCWPQDGTSDDTEPICNKDPADIPRCTSGQDPREFDSNGCKKCRDDNTGGRPVNCTKDIVALCHDQVRPWCPVGFEPTRSIVDCCLPCHPRPKCLAADFWRCRKRIRAGLIPECGANEEMKFDPFKCCVTCIGKPPSDGGDRPRPNCTCTRAAVKKCYENRRPCALGETPHDINPVDGTPQHCCPSCVRPSIKNCVAKNQICDFDTPVVRKNCSHVHDREDDSLDANAAPTDECGALCYPDLDEHPKCQRDDDDGDSPNTDGNDSSGEVTPNEDEICVKRGHPGHRRYVIRRRRCVKLTFRRRRCNVDCDHFTKKRLYGLLRELAIRHCERACNSRRCHWLNWLLDDLKFKILNADVNCNQANDTVIIQLRVCFGVMLRRDFDNGRNVTDAPTGITDDSGKRFLLGSGLEKRQSSEEDAQFDELFADMATEVSEEFGEDLDVQGDVEVEATTTPSGGATTTDPNDSSSGVASIFPMISIIVLLGILSQVL